MLPRGLIAVLVFAVVGLLALIAVLLGVARLLAAMDDTAWAAVLDRSALIVGIAWVVSLVGLVVCLGIESSNQNGSDDSQS